jgi:hypothetical protein
VVDVGDIALEILLVEVIILADSEAVKSIEPIAI